MYCQRVRFDFYIKNLGVPWKISISIWVKSLEEEPYRTIQTKVAQAINVTFQQIQKYEKGTNELVQIDSQLSQFLKVPIIYFLQILKI